MGPLKPAKLHIVSTGRLPRCKQFKRLKSGVFGIIHCGRQKNKEMKMGIVWDL